MVLLLAMFALVVVPAAPNFCRCLAFSRGRRAFGLAVPREARPTHLAATDDMRFPWVTSTAGPTRRLTGAHRPRAAVGQRK